MKSLELVEHFFRHEYGRLVSNLSRQVGLQHIEIIEDSVQSALLAGLQSWTAKGLPENPTAWLYKVARNNLVSQLRQRTNHHRIHLQHTNSFIDEQETTPTALFSKELDDSLLRMLFVCCNNDIPTESQLVFALKALCGFSISEIALRLFCSEANAYKRLSRAKSKLQKDHIENWDLSAEEYALRISNVHKILYLLFTEGHLSVNNTFDIRMEMCDEAIRLATILSQHNIGQTSETFALLALMHFQTARMDSRQNSSAGLLLLEEQDRNRWDQHRIHLGMQWLELSATGENFSRFHAEAGIAAEHCLAVSFDDTRWDRIADCYALLEQITPSAIHRLNRAVAVAEWQGPNAGLEILQNFLPPSWLSGSYLWSAVLADLYRRCGETSLANKHRDDAIHLAPTTTIKNLLYRRLSQGKNT